MKTTNIIKLTLWTAALLLVVGCSSTKGLGRHSGRAQSEEVTPRGKYSDQVQRGKKAKSDDTAGVQEGTDTATVAPLDKGAYIQQVNDNAQTARFITSKIKFSVEIGNRQMTLTGNLKMKRDDVIRLQLMAFGFVEAGRLEFTKDYVLIVDRINKQYLKVPYDHLEFLRSTNINFNTLQALFWNQLAVPGKNTVEKSDYQRFSVDGKNIKLTQDNMTYNWATAATGQIVMTNINYATAKSGASSLLWMYSDFKPLGIAQFPAHQDFTFTTSATKQLKTVKVKLDSDTDDSLHLYKANELCAVPGGRPKDGETPPHVLHYVPEEPEEEELVETESWDMPTLVVPEVKEESLPADKPARDGKSRRRRRRGGEKKGEKSGEKSAPAPEKSAAKEKPARGERSKHATVKPVKLTVKNENAAPAKAGGESAAAKEKRPARPNRRRRSRGKGRSGAAE